MLNKKNRKIFYLLLAVVIFGGQVTTCLAQDESKSIFPDDYVKRNRPARAVPVKSTVNAGSKGKTRRTIPAKPTIGKADKAKKRFYRAGKSLSIRLGINQPIVASPVDTEEAMLGLTIWKIRPETGDNAAKGLIEEAASGKAREAENILERNDSATPLAVDDRVRISLESLSRSGYLYVIDRELYSDGTYSSPQLIYPTLKTRKRNAPVSAGDLIFIPEAGNFRVTSNQIEKKQVAEVLTVIISPRVLIEESMLKAKAIDLPAAQFADWLKRWEAETVLLEQIDGAGQTITPVEEAAIDSAKGLTEESIALTRDDPTPQTVYRAGIKRGNPLLINVFLKFRSN